jgi:hypothetical protein
LSEAVPEQMMICVVFSHNEISQRRYACMHVSICSVEPCTGIISLPWVSELNIRRGTSCTKVQYRSPHIHCAMSRTLM